VVGTSSWLPRYPILRWLFRAEYAPLSADDMQPMQRAPLDITHRPAARSPRGQVELAMGWMTDDGKHEGYVIGLVPGGPGDRPRSAS
jgi:hypothetical protein